MGKVRSTPTWKLTLRTMKVSVTPCPERARTFHNVHVHLDGVTGAEVRNIRPKRRLVNEIEGLHDVSSLRRHRSHANISKEVEL
jgi:hypothetical protein